MELIWASCYSYNNKVAHRFLTDETLAFLFLVATKMSFDDACEGFT